MTVANESAPGFSKYPDHRVEIEPSDRHIRVLVGSSVIADTHRALAVQESRHDLVWYLPMQDVNTELLKATQTSTYCPFKGHASYWSIMVDGEELEDAVWSYESPYRECHALRDHVAFYPSKVTQEIDGLS